MPTYYDKYPTEQPRGERIPAAVWIRILLVAGAFIASGCLLFTSSDIQRSDDSRVIECASVMAGPFGKSFNEELSQHKNESEWIDAARCAQQRNRRSVYAVGAVLGGLLIWGTGLRRWRTSS